MAKPKQSDLPVISSSSLNEVDMMNGEQGEHTDGAARSLQAAVAALLSLFFTLSLTLLSVSRS